MNKIRNEYEAYGHAWVIVARKRLSKHDRMNAVNNFIALNEGKVDFTTGTAIAFDLDTMAPVSEAEISPPVPRDLKES